MRGSIFQLVRVKAGVDGVAVARLVAQGAAIEQVVVGLHGGIVRGGYHHRHLPTADVASCCGLPPFTFIGVVGHVCRRADSGSPPGWPANGRIPASGARLAEKAGSLILTWEYPLELIPGGYTMELNLNLRSAA